MNLDEMKLTIHPMTQSGEMITATREDCTTFEFCDVYIGCGDLIIAQITAHSDIGCAYHHVTTKDDCQAVAERLIAGWNSRNAMQEALEEIMRRSSQFFLGEFHELAKSALGKS